MPDLSSPFDLRLGDSRNVLKEFPDNSIDSCVTDPPYALESIVRRYGGENAAPTKDGDVYSRSSAGFMGQTWDTGETAFDPVFWREVWRVLKPGGFLLAFSGTRTVHRLTTAIELAGFEVRDRYRYECGPETKYGPLWDSLDGVQRGALAELLNDQVGMGTELAWEYGSGFPKSHNQDGDWEGWGTALKPAYEPIVVARKPLIGTVAENLAQYRTGALNIDACRVETGGEEIVTFDRIAGDRSREQYRMGTGANRRTEESAGRWPANVIHDGSPAVLEAFAQFGEKTSGANNVRRKDGVFSAGGVVHAGLGKAGDAQVSYGDRGSAARFFYCAKTSKQDREEGCEQLPDAILARSNLAQTLEDEGDVVDAEGGGFNKARRRKNNHPTVKPTELMAYLCRLVTVPGGVVLDPFMGSGSTGKAAMLEGFRFLGIERDDHFMTIAEARVAFGLKRAAEIAAEAERARAQLDLFAAE